MSFLTTDIFANSDNMYPVIFASLDVTGLSAEAGEPLPLADADIDDALKELSIYFDLAADPIFGSFAALVDSVANCIQGSTTFEASPFQTRAITTSLKTNIVTPIQTCFEFKPHESEGDAPLLPEMRIETSNGIAKTTKPKKTTLPKKNTLPNCPLCYIGGEPSMVDVRFGRGDCNNQHPGNKYFFSLIKKYQPDYKRARAVDEKRAIVRKVGDDIRRCNGRFLKQDSNKAWYAVPYDDAAVRNKISQSLRDNHSVAARKKKRADHQEKKRSEKLKQ